MNYFLTLNNFYENELKPDAKYLSYVTKHKLNMIKPGLQVDAGLGQILLHDWSKFKPSIFFPYADYFYGPRGRLGTNDPEIYRAFKRATIKHFLSEKHHNYRLGLPTDFKTKIESVLDWYSVAKTNDPSVGDFKSWFEQHKLSFEKKLPPEVITYIEEKIQKDKSWNIF